MCNLKRCVGTYTCPCVCVPSLREVHTCNLKLNQIQLITATIFIIYSTEQQTVTWFCSLGLRNLYGMAC